MAQRAVDVLQPGRLVVVGVQVAQPALGPAAQALARSDRDERARHRVAAVVEHDERAGMAAADAQLDHHLVPGDPRGPREVAVHGAGAQRPTEKRASGSPPAAGAAAGPRARPSSARRARAPPAVSSRSSTCRRSPGRRIVEPRGGIASLPRTITLTTASRGSAEVAHAATRDASLARRELEHLRAEPADRPRLGQRARKRRLGRGDPQPPGQRLERRALHDVESRTAKKTMLKRSMLSGTPSMIGKVARTTGTAPRSPAQPSTTRSEAEAEGGGRDERRKGRATNSTTSASTVPSIAKSASSAREDEQPEREEHRQLGHPGRPWWNDMIVCCAGMRATPSVRPAR